MRSNRGAALLLVLLLVSLLAIMVVEFQRSANLELRAAANMRDDLRAHALARSGASVGEALLLADLEDNQHDHRGDNWTLLNDLPVPVGDALIGIDVEDLDGKFPLGALLNDRGELVPSAVAAFERFLEALNTHLKSQPDLADADILEHADLRALVDALVDWIDRDDTGDYERYQDYTAPNAPLASLDELYRIEGYNVRPEGYGHAVVEAILPYVDTRGAGGPGKAQINVNTAEEPVLVALHPDMDYDKALQLYADLGEAPEEKAFSATNYEYVRQVTFHAGPFTTAVKSQRFRVRLSVDVGGVLHTAEALLVRSESEKTVATTNWRQGWMGRRWRHRAPAPASSPLLEGLSL